MNRQKMSFEQIVLAMEREKFFQARETMSNGKHKMPKESGMFLMEK